MKLIAILIAVAIYGVYSAVGNFMTPAPADAALVEEQTPASTSLKDLAFSSAAGLAASAASTLASLNLQPLPDTGCTKSILAPEQVLDLVYRLPEAQRATLAKVLDTTSAVWTAQLYLADSSVGLCFPTLGKMLQMPGVAVPNWVSDSDLAAAVRSVARPAE